MKWQATLPILALMAWPAVAFAQEIEEPDGGLVDGGAREADDINAPPPLECGGKLCDSSNGSTCAMSTPAPAAPIVLVAAAVLPLAALARRRRR